MIMKNSKRKKSERVVRFQKTKKEKGITLIALVITIVVLLILAGVSISMLAGENGIITQAQESELQTEIGKEKEELNLAVSSVKSNKIINNDTSPITDRELNQEFNNNNTKATAIQQGEDTIEVTFESGRKYIVNSDGSFNEQNVAEQPEKGEKNIFSRKNGKVDIVFLEGTSYNISSEPNEPNLSEEMVPVKFSDTDNAWIVCSKDDSEWYEYVAKEENGDNNASKWANVMLRENLKVEGISNAQDSSLESMIGKKVTQEGSMFVWIPRYAYKITYYDVDDTDKTGQPIGYSDARGIINSEYKNVTGQDALTAIPVGDYYRTHPCFEEDLEQGGWSKKLTGIWVGKFESSKSSNSQAQSIPSVNTNWDEGETIGDKYTYAYNFNRDLESHMAKNSEWGAVVYLTNSKYGRNQTEISRNADNWMGYGGAIAGGDPAKGKYIENMKQTTTGNPYGIYDMSGGNEELTSAYLPTGTTNTGNSFASDNPDKENSVNDKMKSTQYATVYALSQSNDIIENYNLLLNKKFGDAVIETSENANASSAMSYFTWESNSCNYMGEERDDIYPFMRRGGSYTIFGGCIYKIVRSNGGGHEEASTFRLVLAF